MVLNRYVDIFTDDNAFFLITCRFFYHFCWKKQEIIKNGGLNLVSMNESIKGHMDNIYYNLAHEYK